MARRRFGVFSVFGIMLMLLGGGCTLFWVDLKGSLGGPTEDFNALAIGAIPFAVGLFLLIFDVVDPKSGTDVDDASP